MSRRNFPSGRVFSAADWAGLLEFDGVIAEVGQAQVLEQQAAVGVGIGGFMRRVPWG